MDRPVKILHVEDIRSDADVVKREMQKSALPFEWLWAPGKKDFELALLHYHPDIILCDHSMPGFSSVEAIRLIKDAGLDIPFILITATISEDVAAIMMQHGIADYLLKDRLQRLPAAVANALKKWQAEKQKQAYLEEIIGNEARTAKHLVSNLFVGQLGRCIPKELKFPVTYCHLRTLFPGCL
jgi:DNA-binding NtrC family response regulator